MLKKILVSVCCMSTVIATSAQAADRDRAITECEIKAVLMEPVSDKNGLLKNKIDVKFYTDGPDASRWMIESINSGPMTASKKKKQETGNLFKDNVKARSFVPHPVDSEVVVDGNPLIAKLWRYTLPGEDSSKYLPDGAVLAMLDPNPPPQYATVYCSVPFNAILAQCLKDADSYKRSGKVKIEIRDKMNCSVVSIIRS